MCVANQSLPGAHLLEAILPLPKELAARVSEFWGGVLSYHLFSHKIRHRELWLLRAVTNDPVPYDAAKEDWSIESSRLWDLPADDQLWILREFVKGDESIWMECAKLVYFLWDRLMGDDEGAQAAAADRNEAREALVQSLALQRQEILEEATSRVAELEVLDECEANALVQARTFEVNALFQARNVENSSLPSDAPLLTTEAKLRAVLRTIVFTLDEFHYLIGEDDGGYEYRYGYDRPTARSDDPGPPDVELLPPPGRHFRNYHLLCFYPLLARSRGLTVAEAMLERAGKQYYNDAHEGLFFSLHHWDHQDPRGLIMLRRMVAHWQEHYNIVLNCSGTGIDYDQTKVEAALLRAGVISGDEEKRLWDD